MEAKGAALATGLAQTIALLILLPHFLLKKGIFDFRMPIKDGKLFKEINEHGLPTGIGQFYLLC